MFSLKEDKADEFINHSQKEDINYIKESAEAFDKNQMLIKKKRKKNTSNWNDKLDKWLKNL